MPSYVAVARSSSSPLQSRAVKRTTHPRAAVERTISAHTDAEFSGAAQLAAVQSAYAAVTRSSLPPLISTLSALASSASVEHAVAASIKADFDESAVYDDTVYTITCAATCNISSVVDASTAKPAAGTSAPAAGVTNHHVDL